MQQVQYFQETLDEFVVVFREGGVLFSGHTAGQSPCFGEKLSYRPVLLVTCSTAYRTTVRKGQFVISLKFLRR